MIIGDFKGAGKTGVHYVQNEGSGDKKKHTHNCKDFCSLLMVRIPRHEQKTLGLKQGLTVRRMLSIRRNQISIDAAGLGQPPARDSSTMPSMLSMSPPVVRLHLAPGASAKSGGPYQGQKLPGSGLAWSGEAESHGSGSPQSRFKIKQQQKKTTTQTGRE